MSGNGRERAGGADGGTGRRERKVGSRRLPRAVRTGLITMMAASLGCLALVACGSSTPSGASDNTIIIGADYGMTGSFSLLGQPDDAGAQAYVNWLNAHAGTKGVHYKLITVNNQSTPSDAATVARTLIAQDHASVILGPEETSELSAVAEVAAAYHVIDIATVASQAWPPTDPGLTSNELKYVFPELTDFNTSSTQAYDAAVWAPKKDTKIALLTDSTPFGLDEIPAIQALAAKDGFTIVGQQTFAAGATDVTPQVQNLLNDHPQFLLSWTTPGPDTIAAVKAVRSLDPALPLGIAGGQDTPATVSTLGATDAANLYAIASIAQPTVIQGLPSSDSAKAVANEFTQVVNQYHVDDDGGANTVWQGWDAVYVLDNAVRAANGSTSTNSLLSALDNQHLTSLADVWVRTPDNHGAVSSAPGFVAQYNGSTWVYVGGTGT
jgi:branched-chain amino acid transport system substrate-binding protein